MPMCQSAAALEVLVEEAVFPESDDLAGGEESAFDSDELDAAVFSVLIPEELEP